MARLYGGVNGLTEENWAPALENVLRKMIVDENGCWLWQGCLDKKTGYGQVRIGDKLYKVHRFIAYCFHGLDIYNRDLDACHTCDIRNCINPFHIWLGTRSQNLEDSVRKGRWHSGSLTGRNKQFRNHLKDYTFWKRG